LLSAILFRELQGLGTLCSSAPWKLLCTALQILEGKTKKKTRKKKETGTKTKIPPPMKDHHHQTSF